MSVHRFGRVFGAQILLSFVVAAHASFHITDKRLFRGDSAFPIRGVVYDNTPIGQGWSDSLSASACTYARDFPLIGGLGANTVRTIARVPPGERAFAKALEANDLYWLAGFPLDRFYNPAQTLSPESQQGQELRSQILSEFRDYVEGWKDEPRVIAFVFGEDVALDYNEKFSGSVQDFYSLLRQAGTVLREAAGDNSPLLTTAVSDTAEIGDFVKGSDDSGQPDLAFWSVNRLGNESLEVAFREIVNKTAKPFLISTFGIDAYNGQENTIDEEEQANSARARALDIDIRVGGNIFPVLGGLWGGFADFWWKNGAAGQHDSNGSTAESFPDGQLNPEWMGLFETAETDLPGLNTLRPREAYFALAEQWGGAIPEELSIPDPPQIDPGGVLNLASGQPQAAPGGLVRIQGSGFAADSRSAAAAELPNQLGAVSACAEGEPIPLIFADQGELRGQLPWTIGPGTSSAIVYRAGMASNVVAINVSAFSPGIFENGVFRPGLPCPVNEQNGVRPGSYLEIYSTGLGQVSGTVVNGLAPAEGLATTQQPQVTLGDRELPVLYSGVLPGVVGIYQTNIAIPDDFPSSSAELRLTQGGSPSNAHLIRVVQQQASPGFDLIGPSPASIVIQQGGPPQTAFVELSGFNSFCELVRFRIGGLPSGVKATIPVGVPGQVLPLTISAGPDAPALAGITGTLRAFSSLGEDTTRSFQVTILPSRTDATFRVVSGGYKSMAPVASFEINGNMLHRVEGGGPGRGFNFLTADARTGTLGAVRIFDTFESEADVEAMEIYLQALPVGTVVFGAIADEGTFLITDDTRRIIQETLGSELIQFVGFQHSWAIITRKNATKPIAEGLSPNGLVVLERTLSFPLP